MYTPAQDGFSVRGPLVRYTELPPAEDLVDMVHCFWELRTLAPLSEDFLYHALPDACVNLLLNLLDTDIAGVTALHVEATTLNLGREFHYVGVQLLPGAWRGDPRELANRYVGTAYTGELPLVATAQRVAGLPFGEMPTHLAELVHWCVAHGFVGAEPLMARILSQVDAIRSVGDMAALVGLSPRQLQRRLKHLTGFAPHDLLKVLRVQQSFRRHYLNIYADQAHFIHAFRDAIGYTPGQYRKTFGV